MGATPLLLAIDAGTGSCRALLFDLDCRLISSALREWRHQEPDGVTGGRDFDVDANWAAIVWCIREATRRAGVDTADIRAVSSTSMREGVVLYDAAGREIWACPNVDGRAVDEAAELVRDGRAEQIFREGGDWVSMTTPARLLWLARHRPDLLERVAGIGMLSDWILCRLSGELVTEPSCGSSSGMFDLGARVWSRTTSKTSGFPFGNLPPVVDPGTVIGEVTAAVAEQTGLRAGTPVVVGGADTQLALLGAGIGESQYAVIGGTFWQNTVLLGEPLVDPEIRLRTLCHVIPGQWMLEGIGFYCGMGMRWFRDAFCEAEVARAAASGEDIDAYTFMEAAAAAVPPGSNGVLAILSGLMNARRWVQASPSFLQFDVDDPVGSGKAACIRALEEAAAYVVRGHRDIIRDVTGSIADDVIFTGGAAKGTLWPQIIADVLDAPVHVPLVKESSALGAAVCAGTGVGVFASLVEPRELLAGSERTLLPDREAAASYTENYRRWQAVYERMLSLSDDGLLNPLWRPPGV
ncbi:autoinducer-2 kinase [Kribbella solani]|uniref:autoinducer-2 kinase n=1 Tax=Kribbella solani TaxID=236067 RepID=UPI0029AFDBEB|nr:autoinducer-2 kinase [Kribbella solani]MDX2970132.1 autoinducer-2 kinase [Kribbella solani]MDX3004231.1 autoinducer-2 kinase [Kribbella solani]